MSVNYYLDSPDNDAGHLGKKSAGWAFVAYAPEGVTSFADWVAQIPGHRIFAEHGIEETIEDFLKMVLDSRGERVGAETDNWIAAGRGFSDGGIPFFYGYFC